MYELIIGFLAAVALYGLFFTFLYLLKENNLLVSSEKLKKSIKYLIITTAGLSILVLVAIVYVIFGSATKNHPDQYIVRMEDASDIGHNSDVCYRGVDVGTVNKIELSEDGKYALVKIIINNKNLKIVEGTKVEVISSTIGNDLGLILPDNPELKKVLPPGSYLEQDLTNKDKSFNTFVHKLFSGGKANELVDNLNDSFKNLSSLTKSLKDLNDQNKSHLKASISNLESVTANLKDSTSGLKEILGDKKNIKNISATIESTEQAMKNLNTAAENTASLVSESTKTVESLNRGIADEAFQKNVKDSVSSISGILHDVESITSDEKTMKDLKDLINETGSSLKTINCVTKEIGNTLGKRFLMPRMLLGRPGKNVEICFPEAIEDATNDLIIPDKPDTIPEN